MRIVAGPDDLLDAVDSARREAGSAFGDDTVFLERYLVAARHIEIQVFGDIDGNVVPIFERECSIQRRHQKIIEEAPSPALDDHTRSRMGKAAVAVARSVGYVGAGTVEFLYDGDQFFFLEMNTRLQVEHAVTEEITSLDLVRLQLLVADGEALPEEAMDPAMLGHAIEARLYAEDPLNGYLPAAGRLDRFEFPSLARPQDRFRGGERKRGLGVLRPDDRQGRGVGGDPARGRGPAGPGSPDSPHPWPRDQPRSVGRDPSTSRVPGRGHRHSIPREEFAGPTGDTAGRRNSTSVWQPSAAALAAQAERRARLARCCLRSRRDGGTALPRCRR